MAGLLNILPRYLPRYGMAPDWARATTERRIAKVEFDDKAEEFLAELAEGEIRIVTNRRESGQIEEYRFKEHEKRIDNHIPSSDPVLFY